MQIHNLFDLGWSNYFQSQLDLDAIGSQLPFRVIAVQRDLFECLGLDRDNRQKLLHISAYHWRNEPPEAHPTVGDWIMLDTEYQALKVLERKTLIKRRSPGKESAIQLIAANIDTVFIITSCNDEFNINRIDRYLSIAAESGIHCIVVLTKVDLCEDVAPFLTALADAQPQLHVEQVNATDATSLEALKKWITPGQTVALLGSSGVGKSTITNSLSGNQEQSTAAIREQDSKGRHTTTSRSLHVLADGGLLLDSPGMRELQMVDNEAGIKATFSDIEALTSKCRFRDCQHQSEPGCAVIEALESGKLEQERFDNYHKLLAEQARNSASLAQRRQNDKAMGRFYKSVMKSSRKFKSRE